VHAPGEDFAVSHFQSAKDVNAAALLVVLVGGHGCAPSPSITGMTRKGNKSPFVSVGQVKIIFPFIKDRYLLTRFADHFDPLTQS
jgi:hypothetical protein